jgi:tol-pal system protein YbgF
MDTTRMLRVAFLLVVGLLFSGCASWTTTEKEDLLSDVTRLKHDMRELKGPTSSGGGLRDQLAEMDNRLNSIETQLAQLKGVDEDFNHRLAQIEGNMQTVGGGASAYAPAPGSPGMVSPGSVTEPGGASSPSGSLPPPAAAVDNFDAAMRAFNDGRYKEAETFFSTYIKENPRSSKLEDAYFFEAESQFSQRDYEDAIVTYDEFRKRYRSSRRIPAALLKQGLAFKALGFKSDARPFFRELIKLYPSSPEAAQARREMES